VNEFGIVVSFDSDHATVAVRGDVDLLTASTLHAAIGSLVDQGHLDIILDLASVTFMDASGLRVIVDISTRLSWSGHTLILRSASPMTRRILDITKVGELVRLEGPVSHDAHGTVVYARSQASNEVIDASLRRVTELVGATIPGADGVSITLERAGRLMTVGASNDTVLRMDGHQYETGEGPCLSATADGQGFHIESLAEETRWPDFVPLAIEQGIASILSTPLITAERSVGALNIYSNSERAFGTHEQELAGRFASQASGILTDFGVLDDLVVTRLADALAARQTIARAQGVLMARGNITADMAAAAIHRSARADGVLVARRAAAIVASTQTDTASAK
jgi:anti-anti-sigma factor